MKSRFKVLSLATAVLFATSCSKDDSNDSIVDDVQQQEEVVVKERSVTVTGKATSQSGLSKLSIVPGEEGTNVHTVSFNDGDEIAFDNGAGIHGSGKIGADGESFTLDIKYPAENGGKQTDLNYLNNESVTLCIGNKPTGVEVYDNAKDCIYEEAVVTFSVSAAPGVGGTTYNLNSLGEVKFAPMVAIIENESREDCTISVESVTKQFKNTQFAAVNKEVNVTIQYRVGTFRKTNIEAKYYKFYGPPVP